MAVSGPHNYQSGEVAVNPCISGGQTPPDPSSSALDPNNFTPNGLVIPGPQGIQGERGDPGYSGYSGESGASGYSGMRGPTGLSGTSGTSGFSGLSGLSGTSGTSGTSGFSGYSGLSGYSGFSGTPNQNLSVVTKTTDYIVLSSDSCKVFNNTGAGANVTFTLPTATSGLKFTFQVKTAQNIIIDPGTANIIVGSDSGTIDTRSNLLGASLTIICDGTDWVAECFTRTWTVT